MDFLPIANIIKRKLNTATDRINCVIIAMHPRIPRILALLLALAVALTAEAQPYFCTRQGAKLHYVRHETGSGRVRWEQTLSIDKVAAGADSTVIAYSTVMKPRRGNAVLVELDCIIDARDNLSVSIGSSVRSVFASLLPKADIASIGDERSVIPSAMKTGDVLPDASAEVKLPAGRYVVKVTDRKVLRSETITTPAGTFDCMVVSEHKVEKAPGVRRETTASTWYAGGVGMVRHDTYDKDLRLVTSEVLESISD